MKHLPQNRLTAAVSKVSRLGFRGYLSMPVLGVVASASALAAPAHNIVEDTAFTDVLATGGNTFDITSKLRTANNHEINVFDNFVVGENHTINLKMANTADKLVNIVRGSSVPEVHGILNSYQNGSLGGDVVFASSAGFLIGETGIVNVGKLILKTPSEEDMLGLFSSGSLVGAQLNSLLANEYSISPAGTVTIRGKLNTAEGVDIDANQIIITEDGKIVSGDAKAATYVDYAADPVALNIGDLTIPTELKRDNSGVLLLTAHGLDIGDSSAASIDGDLYADAGITIHAKSIDLLANSALDTENTNSGVSNWQGDVTLRAEAVDSQALAEAEANTSIKLWGDIKADDVEVVASSQAVSSFYEGLIADADAEDTLASVGNTVIGGLTGLSGYYVDSDAVATVKVFGGANIQAAGNVTLTAESHAVSDAPTLTMSGTLVGLAGIYAELDSRASVRVYGESTIESEGDLNVLAHNEAYLSASAISAVAADSAKFTGALAWGDAEVDASAIIESGAILDAANLTLNAENQSSFLVAATAYGLTSQAYGATIAVGDFDTNATAELGASLGTSGDQTGDITVAALNHVAEQRVHSSVAVGANILIRAINSKTGVVNGLQKMQTGVNNLANQYFLGKVPVTEAPNEDDPDNAGEKRLQWKAGGAFALNLGDQEAYASIGNNVENGSAPAIEASGDVAVIAQTGLLSYRTSAEASISSPDSGDSSTPASENSLALAINLAIQENDAAAEVGDYVSINAENLGVRAEQFMPITSTYDEWDSLTKIFGRLNGVLGLQNNLLTSFANAGAEAATNGYGGSFNLLINDLDTKAWIGDNVQITTTGNGDWDIAYTMAANAEKPSLGISPFPGGYSQIFDDKNYAWNFGESNAVFARNQAESINIAGNAGALLLRPGADSNGPGAAKGKTIGGSISYIELDSDAVAGIGASSINNAAGDLEVIAINEDRHWVIAPSSGSGKGSSFNGIAGILNLENIAHASLSNLAEVNVDTVLIAADQSLETWAAAGAAAKGDQSAVGIAAAVNYSTGDTRAYIGDNTADDDNEEFDYVLDTPLTPAPELTITAGITSREVDVQASTHGLAASLAVAGAMTSAPGSSSLTDQFVSGAKKGASAVSALASSVYAKFAGASSGDAPASASSASSPGASGETPQSESSVGAISNNATRTTGAGSFTLTYSDQDAYATIDGAIIHAPDNAPDAQEDEVDVSANALNQHTTVSASGAAALAMADPTNNTQRSSAIAGAIAYQLTANNAEAVINGGSISNAGDVKVQALLGGEKTTIALGLAVNNDIQNTDKSQAGGFSISGVNVRDRASARIEGDVTIEALDSDTDDDTNSLEVTAYNNSHIGAGGGALYAGKTGAGLAVTWADIDDVDSGTAAIEAKIDGATLSNFDQLDISARNLARIGIGAAGVGLSNTADASGYAGSFAISNIGVNTEARLLNAEILKAGVVNVNAQGTQDASLDDLLTTLENDGLDTGYDFTGASVFDNVALHTSDDGSASGVTYESEGAQIIAVAGTIQVGIGGGTSSNFGLAYVHSDIHTSKIAEIQDSNINENDIAATSINVDAREDTDTINVAVGVGFTNGSLSGVGSVSVIETNNQVTAQVGDWDAAAQSGVIKTNDMSVQAQNSVDMFNIAGAVGVSAGTGAAAGLAVTLNLMGNETHATKARIANVDLDYSDDLTIKALSGSADNSNLLVNNAIGVGVSTGDNGNAFAGAVSTSNVDQSVDAGLKNTGTNNDSVAISGANTTVEAYDHTDSIATAWSIAGSAGGSALGVSVATNRVDSDVTAEVLGDDSTTGSTTLEVDDLKVLAARDNWLLTIDAGVAASQKNAVAPSIGTGLVDGDVTARISDKARINARGDVLVNADATTVNEVGSGAVGIGIDGGAGAIAVATAAEWGDTIAYVEDATIDAQGQGAGMSVSDGDLGGSVDQPDLSTSGESAANAPSTDDLTTGFANQTIAEGSEIAHGLIVNASSKQKQRAITVSGAGSKNVAISVNVATNSFSGDTLAYIDASQINTSPAAAGIADVTVRANNHSFGLGIAAGVAIAASGANGAAGVGGVASNLQNKDSEAKISNSTVIADAVMVDANSTQVSQAVSAGVAAGTGSAFGYGAAASVVVTSQNGDNVARVSGGTVTSDSLAVNADTRQEANVAAGSVGVGTTSGIGIGLAVNLIGGNTQALVGRDIDNASDNTRTQINTESFEVNADRLDTANSYAFGAGGGSDKGVAAMIDVTEVTGETRAGVYGRYDQASDEFTTTIRNRAGTGKAGIVDIEAQDILNVNHIAMGLGIGSNVGVGAVANVILGRSQVYSELVGSDVQATTLEVDAVASRETDMISVAGGAGSLAGAISLGLVLMGDGDTTTDDGGSASEEFSESRTAINTMMGEDLASNNASLTQEEQDQLNAQAQKQVSEVEGEQAAEDASYVNAGSVLKLSGESATAARISGGIVDVDTLSVSSESIWHSYTGIGAASVSSTGGLGGGLGITYLYDINSAIVDADVTANSINVTATARDQADDAVAAEMKNYVIGASGGVAVGISYSDVRSENRVVAGLKQAVGNDTGDLNVSASDTTRLRIGDISADSTEDGENFAANPTTGNMNINIGAGAVGISAAIARKNSDVDAWLGAFDGVDRTLVDGYLDQRVLAESSGQLKSTAFAASGGAYFAVQGVVTDARDRSEVNATVAGEIDTGAEGTLTVNATAVPETFANAFGVTISAGGAAGGSFSYSVVETEATARVTDATKFTGTGSVSIEAVTGKQESGYESAIAGAFAASGGIGGALSASEAVARSESETLAEVGNFVTLPLGDFSATATSNTKQLADANGYFIGTYVAGLNFSSAKSETSTRVLFGRDPIAAGARLGDFRLLANSTDENQGFTTAGGGGVYSGSAAVSHADAVDTADKRSASVNIADWSEGYTTAPIGAGEVQVEANHQTFFFAGTTSLTVSVVGRSGAWSDADVELSTEVDVGDNVSFFADQIDLSASNNVDQITTPWFGGDFTPSVRAGGGGAANGSAALSSVDISRLNSSVNVGDNSVFKINSLADVLDRQHNFADYRIQMDAFTGYNIYDTVVLKVYGALQGAGAESEIDVNTHNIVNIGQGVKLLNPIGNVEIGAHTRGYATADASVTIGAAIGVAGGVTDVDLDTNNTITIGDNVEIESFDSTKILAGRSADYLSGNLLSANALTNVYNYTAVPIDAAKRANAYASVVNNISIGSADTDSGINVSSVRDIILEANKGVLVSKGKGIDVNTYDVLASTQTTFGNGSSGTNESSTIAFNGNSDFIAGVRHEQSVYIDEAGQITLGKNTVGVAENYGTYSSRASLQAYLDALEAEKLALENEPSGITVDEGAFSDSGEEDADVATSGSGESQTIGSSASRISEIEEEIVFLTPFLERLSPVDNNAILIGGISASGGNVDLKSKTLVVNSGSPTITANGNPSITITNESDSSLILDDLTIPNVGGGSVFVTGDIAGNLPDQLNINESSSEGVSSLSITHSPNLSDGSDVFIQGTLSNLGGIVEIDVEKGDLIQTGSVLAKQMKITAPEGGYLLNNPTRSQSFGFSPESLTGFTSQWKPASPDEMVMYYINARYANEMSTMGAAEFNNWWYGTDYKADYGAASNAAYAAANGDIDRLIALLNAIDIDKDLRVYLNWGFSDADECSLFSPSCQNFIFPNNAGGGSRGNGRWGFEKIQDLQAQLVQTATYQQVKNAGYGDQGGTATDDQGAAVDGQFIGINAYSIDINGTIRAGNFNNWSLDVGEGFDEAMERFVAARGLAAGSTISLNPGETLSWYEDNPEYTWFNLLINPLTPRRIRVTVDPQLSLRDANDAGIRIKYEVGTRKVTVDDVNASGNGYVALRGRLMSTGEDGKILVDDGFGSVDIVNHSSSELVLNDINAGSQSTGVIRITDLNYTDSSGDSFSSWYVHNPGESIQQYITEADATTYSDGLATTVGGLVNGKQSYTYETKKGQVYYFTQREEVERNLDYNRTSSGAINGYISNYDPTGEWFYDAASPLRPDWGITTSSVSNCASLSSVSCNADGSVSTYLTHVLDDSYRASTSEFGYGTSYANYYGYDFTAVDWNIISPTYISMSARTYVKADHPIQFQFVGNDRGSVSVDSRTGIQLNGAIDNSSGVTDLAVDRTLGNAGTISDAGDIFMTSSGVINSDETFVSAVGSIGSEEQAFNVITSHISAVAETGSVNLDITSASDDIRVEKLDAGSTLNVRANQSLMPYGSAIHIRGDAINITSDYGSIGDVASSQTLNVSSQGLVTLSAQGDIALNQASGDMLVNTIDSQAGDISITLGNGNLLNGIDQQLFTDEDLAYQAEVWDRLDLRSETAGEDNVRAYENQVSGQYHSYWLIKQRLDDDSDANFTINDDYLAIFKQRYKAREDSLNGSDLDINAISDVEVTNAVREEYRAIGAWVTEQQNEGLVSSDFEFGSSYTTLYRYAIADDSAAYNQLTEGARWNDSQLEITISSAALEPSTEGYITSRDANISGNNVSLNVQSGRIGEDLDDLMFEIDLNAPDITNQQKSALLQAGPGDLTISETSTALEVTVRQQDPFKVNANGELSLTANQQIYLESDQGIQLLQANSTGGDIRLSASGDIESLSGDAVTISADNLNISTRLGGIGSEAAPLNMLVSGALRNVSAPGDLWLQHLNGPLTLGSIGTDGLLNLRVGGDIFNFSENLDSFHMLADRAVITAASDTERFDIGSASRGVKMELTGGDLEILANNAWLTVDGSEGVNLQSADLLGDLFYQSSSVTQLLGDVTGSQLSFNVNNALTAEQALRLAGTGDVSVVAQSLDLRLADIVGDAVYLETTLGAMQLNDATSAGLMTLNALGELDLSGELTAAQALEIGAQMIAMSDDASIQADSTARVASIGDSRLTNITSGDTLSIESASGNLRIDAAINSGGDLNIDTAQGQTAIADAVVIDTAGAADINGASMEMGEDSQINAEGTISVTTEQGMLIAALVTNDNSHDAVQLTSTFGAINGRAYAENPDLHNLPEDFVHVSAVRSGASLVLNAATGIGDPLVIDTPWLSARTDEGDINVIARSSLTAQLLEATQGNIHMSTFGDLTIEELNGTPWLWVDGLLVANAMTVDRGSLAARDGMNLSQVTLTEGGPLNLQTPELELNLDGNGQSRSRLAVTGFEDNSAAENVDIVASNTGRLQLTELRTNTGSIEVDGDLEIDEANVRNKLAMQTDRLEVLLDNDDPTATSVDAQLLTPRGDFNLELADVNLKTSAQVTRYTPEVVVDYQPSTDSAGGGQAFYRLSAEYQQDNKVQEGNLAPRAPEPVPLNPTRYFEQFGKGVLDEIIGASEVDGQFGPQQLAMFAMEFSVADLPSTASGNEEKDEDAEQEQPAASTNEEQQEEQQNAE